MAKPAVDVIDLGTIAYTDALDYQRKRQRELLDGTGTHCLITCEHPDVITRGRGSKEGSLLAMAAQLTADNIEVFEVERGGDITFHGKGQLVAYPILDLFQFKTDVGWYMRQLEETIIRSLADFDVSAGRIEGKTGVWVDDQSKIASLGVKISRWKTLHGVAVNVTKASEDGFKHIVPCGLDGVRAISIESVTGSAPSQEAYREAFIDHFADIFSVLLRPTTG